MRTVSQADSQWVFVGGINWPMNGDIRRKLIPIFWCWVFIYFRDLTPLLYQLGPAKSPR